MQRPPPDIAERTFAYAVSVVKVCRIFEREGVHRSLVAQLLRSATSVGANVEEAQAAQSLADFISKTCVAL